MWAREAQPRFYQEGLEVPLPNILPNRRRVQHPNTYAPPESTSMGVPAQGLKEEGKLAHDVTVPVLPQARDRPRGCSSSFLTGKLKASDSTTGDDGPETRSREP